MSCQISPPDVEVCVELGQTKGYCAKTLSEDERMIEGSDWILLKRNSLIMPNDSYAQIKAFLLKICKQSDRCDIKDAEKKIDDLEMKANKAISAENPILL